MAGKVPDSGGVYVVPAFTGLGAPWWDPYARGTIVGITRATTKYHLIRAVLESMAFQTADVIDLMQRSTGLSAARLPVDGGASANDLLLSFQADILQCPIDRPSCIETTAFGAAMLAGLGAGIYENTAQIREMRRIERTFEPKMSKEERDTRLKAWRRAVERSLAWKEE